MPANQKRRQKQLERKKAKRKEKHKQLIKQKNRGLAELLADAAAKAPVLDSFISEDAWDEGMGYVIISRELADGHIAVANFLVDRYCLGVKNAFGTLMTKGEYIEGMIGKLESRFVLIKVAPATARKFVEDAVEYARDLGLPPHPDYTRAKPIFGDIDPAESEEDFEFGHDGKPYFIAGPHDTPERCYQILSVLEQACGRDGFHFTMPLVGNSTASFGGDLQMIGSDDSEYDEDEDADEDESVDEAEGP